MLTVRPGESELSDAIVIRPYNGANSRKYLRSTARPWNPARRSILSAVDKLRDVDNENWL